MPSRPGARIKAIPLTDDYTLDIDAYHTLLAGQPKLVAVTHVSNSLGTINDVTAIARDAHTVGATVVSRCRAIGAAPADRRAGRSMPTFWP